MEDRRCERGTLRSGLSHKFPQSPEHFLRRLCRQEVSAVGELTNLGLGMRGSPTAELLSAACDVLAAPEDERGLVGAGRANDMEECR